MLTTLKTLLNIRASTLTNLFIYYLQKLPFVGKHITDQIYAEIGLKKVISVISFVISILWGLLLGFLYIGLLLYLPIVMLGGALSAEDQQQYFVHILIMISFIVSGVGSATILEPKREKYVAVKLMRLSPRRYMLAALSYRCVTYFIYLLLPVIVFSSLLGFSLLASIQLTLSVTLGRILAEYLHLKLFDKTGIVLIKKLGIVWLTIGIGFAVAYVPLLFDLVPITAAIILNIPAFIVLLLAGIYSTFKLAKYSNFKGAVDAATKIDDPLLDIGRMMSEAQKTSVESKASDYAYNDADQNKFGSKQGYHYINAIFFSRHRSLIRKPLYIHLAIIGILTVVGLAIVFAFPEQKELITTTLSTIFPILFGVMYFMSVGEKICRAMFYNSDLSLLRYSFYRASVSSHYRIRLIHIIKLNSIISTALALGLTIITVAAGGELWSIDLLMLWISILLLSVFFSVHHMFMYYIFQPYATEFNMKNPLYFAINMIVSAISGASLFLRAPSEVFASIVFIATLAYLLLSIMLVKKHGTKTFRIK